MTSTTTIIVYPSDNYKVQTVNDASSSSNHSHPFNNNKKWFPSSLFSPSSTIKVKNPISQSIKSCMATTPPAVQLSTFFGFKSLMETFAIDVHKAEGIHIHDSSSRLDKVDNVAIRVVLNNGCVSWGETPILPCVTAEDQPLALAKAAEACQFLKRSRGMQDLRANFV